MRALQSIEVQLHRSMNPRPQPHIRIFSTQRVHKHPNTVPRDLTLQNNPQTPLTTPIRRFSHSYYDFTALPYQPAASSAQRIGDSGSVSGSSTAAACLRFCAPLAGTMAAAASSTHTQLVLFADIDGTLVHYPDPASLAEARAVRMCTDGAAALLVKPVIFPAASQP